VVAYAAKCAIRSTQNRFLSDASWLKPTLEIYCDSAQPWVELGGERQRFPKMLPPR
jgi:hypothetical protein